MLSGNGDLVAKDTEKAKVPNAYFTAVFTGKTDHQHFQAPEARGEVWSKEYFFSAKKDQVREHLNKLKIHRSVGPNGRHPGVLTLLIYVIVRALWLIFQRPW